MKCYCIRIAGGLMLAGLASCSPAANVRNANTSADYGIRIERSCEVSRAPVGAAISPYRVERKLAFEITGFAEQPSTNPTPETRAATSQAAVIDAFIKALVEARRSRGQSTIDFTQRFGPRLTVTHRSIGDGYEATVSLISRGMETTIVVRDGILRHPPHELRALRQIFAETAGEFELLSTDWPTSGQLCAARVACYAPVRTDSYLVGDPTQSTADTP